MDIRIRRFLYGLSSHLSVHSSPFSLPSKKQFLLCFVQSGPWNARAMFREQQWAYPFCCRMYWAEAAVNDIDCEERSWIENKADQISHFSPQNQSVINDSSYLVSMLRNCLVTKALAEGKIIHGYILKIGCHSSIFLGNLLMQMYSKCYSARDVLGIFQKIDQPNIYSWTIMIGSQVRHGYQKMALQLFIRMQIEGILPDLFVLSTVFSAYSGHGDLPQGKQVHAFILLTQQTLNVIVQNSMLSMYAKCGSLEDACKVFHAMANPNIVTWNCLLAAYAQYGYGKEALEILYKMQTKGIIPNEVTSLTMLDVCGSLQAEPKGKHVHARILCTTFGKDLNICNAVFNMYGRCGNVQGAQRIFLSMTRDLVSWNAMLAIYAQNGYGRAALELLKHLQSEGIRPDKFTWTEVFNACANLGGLAESKQMHACFMSLETECDATVHSALIHMYGKCGNMDEAHKIFVTMHCPQLIAWNIMIAACAFNGSVKEALHVFQLLQIEDMIPDNVTYLSILEGIALLAFAKRLHAYVLKSSIHWDIAVATSIVNTYGRCGSPDDAERMFGNISNKNIVSWNTMLNAYAQNGKGREAIQVFQEMQLQDLSPDNVTYVTMFDVVTSLSALFEGKRLHACILRSESKMDLIVSNTLINMYAKCGSLVDACSTFDKLVECDLVTWNAMIVAYAQRDYLSMESIQLFEEMQQDGVMPDKITLSSVLDACANVSALDKGKKTHQIIVMCGYEADVVIGNSLLNMYTKCGRLDSAQMVFENMVERDVVSWTAMMAGYAQYGHGREALQLFKQMLLGGGISDQVTIITILSACGHGGLVNEGLYLFMIRCNTDVILTTEHYGCVVDLLGRAKFLDEAQDFVHSMPVEPVAKTWATLLGACQVETDIERALYAAKNAFDLDRTNPAPYILLSNICAASTTLDVSEDMRKLLKEWQQEEG